MQGCNDPGEGGELPPGFYLMSGTKFSIKNWRGIVERSAFGAVPHLGSGQVGRLIPLFSNFSVSFSDHQNSKNPLRMTV